RGRPLMQELRAAGVPVESDCGGRGICHLCRVWLRAGNAPPARRLETRALGNLLVESGMRLSCQVIVDGPLTVELPVRERRGPR
ncbi:MAG: 2Fe-2S iron-sulfur cluster-binding protein, partial [Myxococcota bacterium]